MTIGCGVYLKENLLHITTFLISLTLTLTQFQKIKQHNYHYLSLSLSLTLSNHYLSLALIQIKHSNLSILQGGRHSILLIGRQAFQVQSPYLSLYKHIRFYLLYRVSYRFIGKEHRIRKVMSHQLLLSKK